MKTVAAALAFALLALPGLAGEEPLPPLKPGESYTLSQTPSDSSGSGWVVRNEGGLRVHVRYDKVNGKGPRPGDIVVIARNINPKAGSAIINADPSVIALRRFAPGSQVEVNFFHDRQGRYGPTCIKVVKTMPAQATITGKVAEKLADPDQVMIEVLTLPKGADGPKGVAMLFKAAEVPSADDKKKLVPDEQQLKVIAGLKEGDEVELAYKIDAEFLRIESLKKAGAKSDAPAGEPKPEPKPEPKDVKAPEPKSDAPAGEPKPEPKPEPKAPKPPEPVPPPAKKPVAPEDDF